LDILPGWRIPENRRLANPLLHERPWLFTFLHCSGIDTTNKVAERATGEFSWESRLTGNGAGPGTFRYPRLSFSGSSLARGLARLDIVDLNLQ
jgi:hypothetical protein